MMTMALNNFAMPSEAERVRKLRRAVRGFTL